MGFSSERKKNCRDGEREGEKENASKRIAWN